MFVKKIKKNYNFLLENISPFFADFFFGNNDMKEDISFFVLFAYTSLAND